MECIGSPAKISNVSHAPRIFFMFFMHITSILSKQQKIEFEALSDFTCSVYVYVMYSLFNTHTHNMHVMEYKMYL